MRTSALLTPLFLLAFAATSAATSIGINFYDSANTATHTVPSSENAGLFPLQGSRWNQFGFTSGVARKTLSSPLIDSNGSPNAATLTLDLNPSFVGSSGASGSSIGNQSIMASYISWDPIDGITPEDSGNIAISGLGPAFTTPGYDVYIYFDADVNTRTFIFTLNGISSTPCADSSTWNGTFREASLFPTDGNVAVFRGLTAANLTLTADSNTGRAAVNAIQIVSRDHPAFDSLKIAFHAGTTTASAMAPATAPTAQGTVVNTLKEQWNHITGNSTTTPPAITNIPLTTSSGLASGTTLAATAGYAGFNSNGWAAGTKDHVMMEGWYGLRATESVTLSNLPKSITNGGYHVIIHGDPGQARTMNYTLDAGSGPVAGTLTYNAKFAGSFNSSNTLVFTGLTGASLTLKGNPGAADTRSAVNGLIIAAGNPTSTPSISSFTTTDAYVTPGTSVTLSWNAPSFDTLTLNPGNIAAAALTSNGNGSFPVTVNSTTTYTLTATRSGESVTRTLRVGAGTPRPNILFFLVDDMGWQDTSEPFLYDASGNEIRTPLNNRYRTPSMEVLADRGMKFTNAYSMPVCSPTRNCWITGINSVRHRVTNWTNSTGTDNDENSTTSHNSPTQWEKGGLSSSHQTLPALLQSAGYRTIHAGKAHFGATPYARQPLNIGFDVNIAGSAIGHPASYFANDNFGTGSNQVTGLESYYGSGLFLTEVLTLEMNKAIEQAVNADTPFFAYMAHYAVHTPFQTDPRFSANYPTLSGTQLAFATLLEGMDKSLGDILAKLDQLGVAENTLVVFMSDNGGDAPFTNVNDSNAPLRHKKGSKYEGGVRAPFIVSWAKRNAANPFQAALPIPAGSHQDDLIAVFDLFPTFASVAGTPVTTPIDGYDLSPYFRATPGTHRPQELLIHFPHDHRSDYFTIFRENEWKLIYNYPSNSYELFNLATDLSETTDLAASQPARVMTMSRKMARQLADAGAQWPTFASNAAADPFVSPNLPAVDVDADSIPDNNEDPNLNGLLDPGETNPESDNTDGDTTRDGDEIKTGTNPLDASSFFRLTPQKSGGSFLVTWPSAPGALYRIESSAGLTTNSWGIVQDNVPATAGSTTTYNLGPIQPGHRFFRAVLK